MIEKRKLCVFDFDGTLVNTAIASPENKEKWSKHYGKPWPYIGWWGREESLDRKVWDMNPIPEVKKDYDTVKSDPSNLVVMLTGRVNKISNLVKTILNDLGFSFDYYLFNRGGNTLNEKINHLNDLLDKFPNIREVELWDDRLEHFSSFKDWGKKLKDTGRIDSFYLNEIKSDQWDEFVEK